MILLEVPRVMIIERTRVLVVVYIFSLKGARILEKKIIRDDNIDYYTSSTENNRILRALKTPYGTGVQYVDSFKAPQAHRIRVSPILLTVSRSSKPHYHKKLDHKIRVEMFSNIFLEKMLSFHIV